MERITHSPLAEFNLGVGFDLVAGWDVLAPGLFYALVKDRLPVVQIAAPLGPLTGWPQGGAEQPIFFGAPPAPRTWFVSEGESALLQVQNNRLHFNWRNIGGGEPYPLFAEMLASFFKYFEILGQFMEKRGCTLNVRAGEISYINHIEQGNHWQAFDNLSGLFAFWLGSMVDVGPLTGVDASFRKSIDDKNGISVALQSAQRVVDNKTILALRLNGTGMIEDPSAEGIHTWMTKMHDSVGTLFVQLLSEEARVNWGVNV